jgi:hypothetical protein
MRYHSVADAIALLSGLVIAPKLVTPCDTMAFAWTFPDIGRTPSHTAEREKPKRISNAPKSAQTKRVSIAPLQPTLRTCGT